jgi:transcriptional regulator with XRE-family HTH domain
MSVGERVKLARTSVNMSQQQLAEAVNLKQPTISELERGLSRDSVHLLKIARVCHVNPHWLSTGEGNQDSQVSVQTATYTTEVVNFGTLSFDEFARSVPGTVAKYLLTDVEHALADTINCIRKACSNAGAQCTITTTDMLYKQSRVQWGQTHLIEATIITNGVAAPGETKKNSERLQPE